MRIEAEVERDIHRIAQVAAPAAGNDDVAAILPAGEGLVAEQDAAVDRQPRQDELS